MSIIDQITSAKKAPLILLLSMLGAPPLAHATPYLPTNGATIVEQLPVKTDPRQRALQSMRQALAANPTNVALAANLARNYIAQSRSDGDPRYLGYAQASLAPWWKQSAAPAEILVLRATLRQSTHQFPAALTDLNAVLKIDRNNPQAWLTRATILQVTGDYPQASASCMHLYSLVAEIVVQTCLNNIGSLNGNAAQSYKALARLLQNNPHADADLKLWLLTLLAESSARQGDVIAADSWFQQALGLGLPDSYLLGAYADFLLDQDRGAEVISLLKNKTRVDALLLRYAIALQQQKLPAAHEQIDVLSQRFAAAMLRGDTVHQREHARFELELKNRPQAALLLAQKNWAIQKEPADLRIYLEAAVALNDRKAAQPVLEWLAKAKLQDQAIEKLVKKLGGAA